MLRLVLITPWRILDQLRRGRLPVFNEGRAEEDEGWEAPAEDEASA